MRMLSAFLLVWRYTKNAIFWVARKGMTIIPITIEFLKPEMTRLLKALKMDLKAYKSDYQAPKYDHSYDTDSYLIGIDNHASASMTNTENDFIVPTKTINVKIKVIKSYLNTT
jgi:hypothetical protein